MDCTLILGDLIAYHFAMADNAERERVEGHLVECKACLRRYLALKAHVDQGNEAPTAPSEASRLRLRAAVEKRFRPTPLRRVSSWLARPIPLYQGFALAAAVVIGVAIAPSLASHIAAKAPDTQRIDTSRTTAESLFIY
jgi:anti-sigma factor RsiW